MALATAAIAAVSTPSPEPGKAEAIFVVSSAAAPDANPLEGVTGVVQSRNPLVAAAVGGGRVVSLHANIGDYVRQGQLLAVIDSRAAVIRVSQAQGELQRAQALAAERASAAARASALVNSGAMSEAEQSNLIGEARSARGAVVTAEAGVRLAQHEVGTFRVYAPGSGYISLRSIEQGAVATPGQTIFAIESGAGQVILAAVPQKIRNSIRAGMIVSYAAGEAVGIARIAGISPRIEDGGVSPVRLEILSGSPAPGSIANVMLATIEGSSLPILRVPASSLMVDRAGKHFVYKVGADMRLVKVAANLIGISGVDARISASLSQGSQVVSAGGAFVHAGQTVKIAKPGT